MRHTLGTLVFLALSGALLAGCSGADAGMNEGSTPSGRTVAPTGEATSSSRAAPSPVAPPPDSRSAEPTGARAESATPSKAGEQTVLLQRVPGSASAACHKVGARRDVRGGDFLAGPFDTAATLYGKKQTGLSRRNVRLYWVPLHSKPMSGLTLKLTNLQTGKSIVIRQKTVADAEQWKFYDTQLRLRQGGTWRAEASSGSDRGCFVFSLPRR